MFDGINTAANCRSSDLVGFFCNYYYLLFVESSHQRITAVIITNTLLSSWPLADG